MQFSVVIPACLRSAPDQDNLARCLAALRAAEPGPRETVVIDDGSPLPVQAPGVRTVRQANGGPASARNRGMAETSGEVVVFVDADIVIPRHAFAVLEAALSDPGVGAAWGTVTAAHPHGGLVSRYKNLSHLHFTLCLERETRHLTTMIAAVRREALARVGGFDEAFRTVSVEDVELGRSLHDAGLRIVLEREIACEHRHRFTVAGAMVNDFRKIRALVAATLQRRRQGSRSTAGAGPDSRRQVTYALGAPFGAGAVVALLAGHWGLALLLALLMVGIEGGFWRFLGRQESWGFAIRCIPWMAVERCTALVAGAMGALDHLVGGCAPVPEGNGSVPPRGG